MQESDQAYVKAGFVSARPKCEVYRWQCTEQPAVLRELGTCGRTHLFWLLLITTVAGGKYINIEAPIPIGLVLRMRAQCRAASLGFLAIGQGLVRRTVCRHGTVLESCIR